MSNVIWHVAMSLDGFIAGPDDAMDWIFEYQDPNAIVDDIVKTTGAILAGRRWYDLAIARWNGVKGIYGGAWSGPVFVLTHRPPAGPADAAITFVSDGIAKAVALALAAARGKSVVLFGATIPQQCLDAHLIDEIVIHLAPVLLGDGLRLHGGPGVSAVKLTRTAVAESGQLTDLRFRVAK